MVIEKLVSRYENGKIVDSIGFRAESNIYAECYGFRSDD